ncbi:hypothetical protein C2G38_2184958 [Gigaspora rosea]|uniref:Uncharacterized protein n=1 Tax=Gigaspora rosea TaxID=44941 RepID=A0A397VAF1_9GLOM|nr:hypothetical protein C2G38_2184958 [Gigaspora rosea]
MDDEIKIEISVNVEIRNGSHNNGIENEIRHEPVNESKPLHTSKKVDISDCSTIHKPVLNSTQINPVKIYDNPEENINAMRSAIDDDSVKFISQEIFEIPCEIFDIIENAGRYKFIGYKIACRIYVVSQELKKSTKDFQNKNKHLENFVNAIKSCKEFVHNISKSIPFMKLNDDQKCQCTLMLPQNSIPQLTVKDLGFVTCLRTSENIKHDKELFHTEIKTSMHTLEAIKKQTNQQNVNAIEEKLKTIHIATFDDPMKKVNVKRGNGQIAKKTIIYRNALQPVAQKEIAYLNSVSTNRAGYKKKY